MSNETEKTAREARLAQALRTNLRKRKLAARPASEDPDPALAAAESAPWPYNVVRRLDGVRDRDGTRIVLTVEISAPYAAPDGVTGAVVSACAVRVTGDGGALDTARGKAAFGVDGLQALSQALQLAQVALDVASTTHALGWPDGRPYDLSAPI